LEDCMFLESDAGGEPAVTLRASTALLPLKKLGHFLFKL
jgi:hypothetical protein